MLTYTVLRGPETDEHHVRTFARDVILSLLGFGQLHFTGNNFFTSVYLSIHDLSSHHHMLLLWHDLHDIVVSIALSRCLYLIEPGHLSWGAACRKSSSSFAARERTMAHSGF